MKMSVDQNWVNVHLSTEWTKNVTCRQMDGAFFILLSWLSPFIWHIHLSLQFLHFFMPVPIDITQILSALTHMHTRFTPTIRSLSACMFRFTHFNVHAFVSLRSFLLHFLVLVAASYTHIFMYSDQITETVTCYLYYSVYSLWWVEVWWHWLRLSRWQSQFSFSLPLCCNIPLRNLSMRVCVWYQCDTALKFYCLYRKSKHISINSCVVNRYWLHTYGLVIFSVPFPYYTVLIKVLGKQAAITRTSEGVCLFFHTTQTLAAAVKCVPWTEHKTFHQFNLDYFVEIPWTIDNWIDNFAS